MDVNEHARSSNFTFSQQFTPYLHDCSKQKHEFPSAHAIIFVMCSIISVEILIITVSTYYVVAKLYDNRHHITEILLSG